MKLIGKNNCNNHIVDNAVMRFNAQQESRSVIESIQNDNFSISIETKQLDRLANTEISITDIIKRILIFSNVICNRFQASFFVEEVFGVLFQVHL